MMQMVGSFAEFERAMIRERTSAGIAAAPAEGLVEGRRKKLDAAKRREIAESVITGRKSGADMACLYGISQPTVSRTLMADLDAGATGTMTGGTYPDGIRQITDAYFAGNRAAAMATYARWLP